MFAVLGSGFGIYGYLPALVRCGQTVVLPHRYRDRVESRTELAQYSASIRWVRDEASALACARGVVLALRPADQARLIERCVAEPAIRWLLLEKPTSTTPDDAIRLHTLLTAWGGSFRVGYSFCSTAWATKLTDALEADRPREISVDWSFMAHHFRHGLANWKRRSDEGGGAIRFFGIQLIALLAKCGYHDVLDSSCFGDSQNEIAKWTAALGGSNVPNCHLTVDCRSNLTRFAVSAKSEDGNTEIFSAPDPFGSDRASLASGKLDVRVKVLEEIVESLLTRPDTTPPWYIEVLHLWRKIEDKTKFHPSPRHEAVPS